MWTKTTVVQTGVFNYNRAWWQWWKPRIIDLEISFWYTGEVRVLGLKLTELTGS